MILGFEPWPDLRLSHDYEWSIDADVIAALILSGRKSTQRNNR